MGIFSKIFGGHQPATPCTIHSGDADLVRSEDMEWWSKLSLQDCKALEEEDNVSRLFAFSHFRETDGLSTEEASRRVRLSFFFYYGKMEHRAETKFDLSADDAKLPYPIKNRINQAVMGGVITKGLLEQSSSANALVRQLIRAERI